MTLNRGTTEERQARLDKMIDEFRDAQKRALLRRGVALWNRTEMERTTLPKGERTTLPPATPTPPDTIN